MDGVVLSVLYLTVMSTLWKTPAMHPRGRQSTNGQNRADQFRQVVLSYLYNLLDWSASPDLQSLQIAPQRCSLQQTRLAPLLLRLTRENPSGAVRRWEVGGCAQCYTMPLNANRPIQYI